MAWAGCTCMYVCMYVYGKEGIVYRVLVGNHEGKRPFWRPGFEWKDNIKIDLEGVGYETGVCGLDLSDCGSSCELRNEPLNTIK